MSGAWSPSTRDARLTIARRSAGLPVRPSVRLAAVQPFPYYQPIHKRSSETGSCLLVIYLQYHSCSVYTDVCTARAAHSTFYTYDAGLNTVVCDHYAMSEMSTSLMKTFFVGVVVAQSLLVVVAAQSQSQLICVCYR